MFLPTAQRGWLLAISLSIALVVIAALVVNRVAFRHRFGNAFLKTLFHAVLFGAAGLAWWYYAKQTPTPSVSEFIVTRVADLMLPVAFSAILVFWAMLLGNLVAFGSRLANAGATALLFAMIYGGVVYALSAFPLGGNLADLVFL